MKINPEMTSVLKVGQATTGLTSSASEDNFNTVLKDQLSLSSAITGFLDSENHDTDSALSVFDSIGGVINKVGSQIEKLSSVVNNIDLDQLTASGRQDLQDVFDEAAFEINRYAQGLSSDGIDLMSGEMSELQIGLGENEFINIDLPALTAGTMGLDNVDIQNISSGGISDLVESAMSMVDEARESFMENRVMLASAIDQASFNDEIGFNNGLPDALSAEEFSQLMTNSMLAENDIALSSQANLDPDVVRRLIDL